MLVWMDRLVVISACALWPICVLCIYMSIRLQFCIYDIFGSVRWNMREGVKEY